MLSLSLSVQITNALIPGLCNCFFNLQELLEIEAELRKVAAELRELRRG